MVKVNALSRKPGFKKEVGFTLVEFAITAAIVGGILAIVVPMGLSYMNSQAGKSEAQRANAIADNVHSIYRKANNFAGLTQSVARDLKVFPEGMDDGSGVYNKWNGAVTVTATSDIAGNANRAFQINEANIKEDSCSDFASGDTGADQIKVNGTIVYERNTTALDVATISGQCAGGASTATLLYEKR